MSKIDLNKPSSWTGYDITIILMYLEDFIKEMSKDKAVELLDNLKSKKINVEKYERLII